MILFQGTQFNVPSGALGFSVLLYTIAALIAMGLLLVRRNVMIFGKAELGGPKPMAYLSAGILIFLWILYIVFSCLQISGVIEANF